MFFSTDLGQSASARRLGIVIISFQSTFEYPPLLTACASTITVHRAVIIVVTGILIVRSLQRTVFRVEYLVYIYSR